MENNKRKIRLGIIWANPYCSNLGVQALAYSTIILFEEIARKANVKFDYTVWGSNRSNQTLLDTGLGIVKIRNVRTFLGGDPYAFMKRCFANPLRIGTPLFALKFFQFDLVADIGAGDSYSDIYGITRFRNINFTKILCQKLHKNYILLPQTLGPFFCAESQSKAKKSMLSADIIFARDKMSYDCVKTLLPNKDVQGTIDVAFFLPYIPIKFPQEKVNVGINISGLLWNGGYTEDNQFNLKSAYQSTMYSILDYFAKMPNVQIHFISHVILPINVYLDEDSKVMLLLQEKYPQAISAPLFKTPIEAKSYISGMDFFTGARMHACIAAISSGVPVYPLAYSRKFNGLFCSTMCYDKLGDLVSMDTEEILDGLCNAYERRVEIKSMITDIISNIITPKKEELINKLTDYIKHYAL